MWKEIVVDDVKLVKVHPCVAVLLLVCSMKEATVTELAEYGDYSKTIDCVLALELLDLVEFDSESGKVKITKKGIEEVEKIFGGDSDEE